MELVTFRGTPGVGDFMWALNSAHHYAYTYRVKLTLEMHWEHEENYLHHFEDPETIIERMAYVHNFYHRQDDVKVKHVFAKKTRYSDFKYADDLRMQEDGRLLTISIQRNKNRFWFESGVYSDEPGGTTPIVDWVFRKGAYTDIVKNKVVIWRPTFNAEIPRTWKRFLTNEDWDDIISTMRQAGLKVTELTYRTPVSEAMYHISTCRQIVCYDGMWHYMARNYHKPTVVVSPEGISKYHTPNAIVASPFREEENNIFWWMNNLETMLGHSKKKAIEYKDKMSKFYV